MSFKLMERSGEDRFGFWHEIYLSDGWRNDLRLTLQRGNTVEAAADLARQRARLALAGLLEELS